MKRAGKIVNMALEVGPPSARQTAGQLVSALATAASKHFCKSEVGIKNLTLEQILEGCPGELRKMLRNFLAGSPESLVGSYLWNRFAPKFYEQSGILPTVLASKEQDEQVLEGLLADAQSAIDFAEKNAGVDRLTLREDFFASSKRVTSACEKAKNENKALAITTDAGVGERQGILSLVSGSKGRIRIFRRYLSDMALQSAALLASILPTGKWVIITACDCILLADMSELQALKNLMTRTSSVYLFTPGIPDATANELPPWIGIATTFASKIAAGLAGHRLFGGHVQQLLAGALTVRERIIAQIAGGDCVPAIRLLPVDRISRLFAEYPAPSYDRRVRGGEFFWYRRPSTAVRASFDQWMLLWERGSGTPESQWADFYYRERRWIGEWQPLQYNGAWLNVNTPVEVYALAQATTLKDAPVWRAKVRAAFGLPPNGCCIESEVASNCLSVEHEQFLLWNTRIDIKKGCKLRIEPGVVICNSCLDIRANKGAEIRIPAGTVIIDSDIVGPLSGEGTGDLIYRLFTDKGLTFVGNQIQSTVYLNDGREFIGYHSIEYNPDAINPRTGSRRAEESLVGGISHVELIEQAMVDVARTNERLTKLDDTLSS